jgi:hypothetical protein
MYGRMYVCIYSNNSLYQSKVNVTIAFSEENVRRICIESYSLHLLLEVRTLNNYDVRSEGQFLTHGHMSESTFTMH